MESRKELPKFAVLQLSGCSGCEVSLLNSDEWINNFNLVYMPLVVTTNKIPEDVEVLLVSGGVRTDEDIHNLRKGASRSKKVIAVGTCALSGGVARSAKPTSRGIPICYHLTVCACRTCCQ